MSSAEESPGSAVLVAELSLSFRDELAASIQSALGVAVEIAVAEVTKLVSQAMRDVRDQMHETLRDNKRLESRLNAAESELRSVHGRLVEAQRQAQVMMKVVDGALPNAGSLPQPGGHERVSPTTHAGLSPERIAECLADLDRSASRESDGAERNGYDGAASFCEIREDGSVCTQGLKPGLIEQENTGNRLEEATKKEPPDVKDYHSVQESPSHFDQACAAPMDGPGASANLIEGSTQHEPCRASPQVAVKVEKTEQYCDPESAPLSEQQEFGSDCLSLAQSRLLEDWRPDLQLQNCQPDPYASSANNALDPSIFPGEIPDLDFLTAPAASQPDPFPSPTHLHREASTISSQVPDQLYPALPSAPVQHVCKVCGQSFLRQVDLRKHRTIMHPKQSSLLRKGPKHSLFPPGRSPYHCSQCGRDFNRMEHLKIHQRIHTGERPYVCTTCSACFRHSWALTRHFRIHTGEMPYQCGQCGKTFRNCGGLKFHQRAHARGQVA